MLIAVAGCHTNPPVDDPAALPGEWLLSGLTVSEDGDGLELHSFLIWHEYLVVLFAFAMGVVSVPVALMHRRRKDTPSDRLILVFAALLLTLLTVPAMPMVRVHRMTTARRGEPSLHVERWNLFGLMHWSYTLPLNEIDGLKVTEENDPNSGIHNFSIVAETSEGEWRLAVFRSRSPTDSVWAERVRDRLAMVAGIDAIKPNEHRFWVAD